MVAVSVWRYLLLGIVYVVDVVVLIDRVLAERRDHRAAVTSTVAPHVEGGPSIARLRDCS